MITAGGILIIIGIAGLLLFFTFALIAAILDGEVIGPFLILCGLCVVTGIVLTAVERAPSSYRVEAEK